MLLLGAGAGLTACTGGAARQAATPPPVDPDDALRDAAASRERSLLREYDAVLLALPELAERLVPLRGHHAEHLLALVGPPATPGASATATATPSAAAAPAVPVPADAAAALARLRAVEAAAGDGHALDCLSASRRLAGLLASLSASEHSHLVALA